MAKKIICILISLAVLGALFVGCGAAKNSSNGGSTKDESSAGTSAVKETTQVQKEVTLNYVTWMAKGEDKPSLERFMSLNPNIKVNDEVIDGTQYDKLLKTRILSGDIPDVILLQFPQYSQYVKEGYLMDVTAEPGMSLLAKTKPLENLFTVDGKRYGCPLNGGVGIFPAYYNKKYFSKLGVVPPKTMDELYALCEKIKADNVEPIVFGGKDIWTMNGPMKAVAVAENAPKYPGIQFDTKLNKGEIKPSDVYKGEFTFFSNLLQKGYVSKSSLSLSYDQSVQYFADGKAALLFQGTYIPGLDTIKNAKDLELGAFVMPVQDVNGKRFTQATVDRSIAISASTKNPDAAKKLFNYFISMENLAPYLESQSLMTLYPIEYKVDPVLQDFAKQVSSSEYEYDFLITTKLTPAFGKEIGVSLQNILAGSTVDTELKRLDEEFEKTKEQMVLN